MSRNDESPAPFRTLLKMAVGESGAGARRNSIRKGSVQDEYNEALVKLVDRNAQRFKDFLLELAEKKVLQNVLTEADANGWTLFHVACNEGRLEEAFALLEAGADAYATTLDNTTGLHYLAKLRSEERQPIAVYNQLLYVLLTKGATLLNQAKKTGETPLHIASSRGNDVAVAFLINAGAEVNFVTKDGFAPLHLAIMSKNKKTAQQLLDAGADAKLYSKTGSPLQMAKEHNVPEIERIIEEAIAHPPVPQTVRKTDHDVLLVEGKGPVCESPVVSGCWDEFRDRLYGKGHFVYYLDTLFYLCILPKRESDAREGTVATYDGLIIDNLGFRKVQIKTEDLFLYKDMPVQDQLRYFLNSRGDMSGNRSKSASVHLALLNSASGGVGALEWVQMSLPDLSARLLDLEARLTPRKRICVGVIYGKKDQTSEQDMFQNGSSVKFERFLSVLGDKISVGPDWPGFLGGFSPVNDEGQSVYYGSWLGFEFIFHVAPFLDPTRQRQHIGNDPVLLIFKEGSQPELEFRGQVNSVAIIVKPVKGDKARAGMRKSSVALASGSSSPLTSSLSDSRGNLTVPPNSPAPKKLSGGSTSKKRKAFVRLSCFHRSRLETFTPNLPEGEIDMIGERNVLRNVLMSAIVNAHGASLRSGPYAINSSKLFVQAISKMITDDKEFVATSAKKK